MYLMLIVYKGFSIPFYIGNKPICFTGGQDYQCISKFSFIWLYMEVFRMKEILFCNLFYATSKPM